MYRFGLIFFAFFPVCYAQVSDVSEIPAFSSELDQLRKDFLLPGLSAAIIRDGSVVWEEYFGLADRESGRRVGPETSFPIASVTKTVAAVLLLQEVARGKLDLDDPVKKWLPDLSLSEEVKIKHLLSHSSEGKPGQVFLYSGRYAWLAKIIEKASGESFPTLLRTRFLDPLSMRSTTPGLDTVGYEHLEKNVAVGYQWNSGLEKAALPRGLSSASGLVSTVRDLALFFKALHAGKLLPSGLYDQMNTPFIGLNGQALEYGYGQFVQQVRGEKIIWSFGQEDAFSSLYLHIPQRKLTLLLLANANLMSDPARLVQGNLLRSRFALAFLKHFVFRGPMQVRIPADMGEVVVPRKFESDAQRFFYREEWIARTFQNVFFAASTQNLGKMQAAEQDLLKIYDGFPELKNETDVSLRHALAVFPIEHFASLKPLIIDVDKSLSNRHPNHAYLLYYRASFLMTTGQDSEATNTWQTLANLPNHGDHWFRIEAYSQLAQYYQTRDISKARHWYGRLAKVRWNYAGLPAKAKEWLAKRPKNP